MTTQETRITRLSQDDDRWQGRRNLVPLADLNRYVGPGQQTAIVPSRHEVIDPYANAGAMEGAQLIRHEYASPGSRAVAMLIKTTAVTLALAILTGAAMLMLVNEFYFLAWLIWASGEWVACFVLLAILDFRETPAAHVRQKTEGYLRLMEREQRARLKALYGYEE